MFSRLYGLLGQAMRNRMLPFDNNIQAFLALVRAGLWEQDVQLASLGQIDFNELYRLAEEQSVVGLFSAGIEHVIDTKVPKDVALNLAGATIQIEQRSTAMNAFIADIVERMRTVGIYTLLIKGQGVAQCYERPLWRACGDIDFLLSNDNYKKAKSFLMPLALHIEQEIDKKHLALTIDQWIVELHGDLHGGLSHRIDCVLDSIQGDIFYGGNVRSWQNGKTQVFQPKADQDAIYIFTHILQHFFRGGIGLRQVFDWCRLLWTYREKLDEALLEKRLKSMGLMSEWKAFSAFVVDYLGMPTEAMPLYSTDAKWKRKGEKICGFILEVGNFGHNRDSSYYKKYPYIIRKIYSFGRRLGDLTRHARIFPIDSIRFFPNIVYNGLRSAVKGEG